MYEINCDYDLIFCIFMGLEKPSTLPGDDFSSLGAVLPSVAATSAQRQMDEFEKQKQAVKSSKEQKNVCVSIVTMIRNLIS